jgi:DNA polymerase-3 subunit alpha
MNAAEKVGLIKFDFLGLKTLDQVRDAVKMVERNTDLQIDLDRIPLDDEAPYALLQKGDGLGVFQVESSGMRDLLKRLKPSNIDDLIALLALYRPGPLSSGMVDNFIDCKHGRRAITYPHPDLEPILKATYGSIVYQEQVMQIAQVLAGYSLGEADLLRRAMGKKKVEAMAAQKVRFVEGAVGLGHDAEKADEIFELLAFFAGYGFNKSHSAAYGIISYQTAWLKANHRAEFMAATMTIDSGNTDKLLVYISDCRRAGLQIISPDVNTCFSDFDVPRQDRNAIHYGLAAVKGVGVGAVQSILEAREEAGGRFEDFMDCLERLDWRRVNKKVIESLVKAGAFDWTGHPRRALFEIIPNAISTAQKAAEEKNSSQTSLFGMMGAAAPRTQVQIPDLGEWPTAVKLGFERDALGFFITGHPLEAYKGIVKRVATCAIDYLSDQSTEQTVTVAGMVTAFRQVRTKRGDKMGFVTLEDPTGSVECVFFPEPWARSLAALRSDQPLLLTGKIEAPDGTEGQVKIMGDSTELLGEVRERRTRRIDLVVHHEELDAERIQILRGLLQTSTGKCPVHIHVRKAGQAWTSLKVGDSLRAVPDDAFMQGLETLFRRPDVPRLI